MPHTLLSFGHGYSARALAKRLITQGWRIIGTTRSEKNLAAVAADGTVPLRWPGSPLGNAFQQATHLLVSAAPDAQGDPVLRQVRDEIRQIAPQLRWIGYLSTTGVYGDHKGGWVDENTALDPSTRRGRLRMEAEDEWRAFAASAGLPLHIFRLAGIYGAGRGPFEKLRNGSARRIMKPGQVFSRIHVDDIAQVLERSIARPVPGAVYNVCDDEPAPPQDVLAYAARLLGMPPPPAIEFDAAEMTPMARSFYAESKRVRNDRIKEELDIRLLYPGYREGLAAILAAETEQNQL